MKEISNLQTLASEINFYKHQTAAGIVEIGKRLVKAKEQVPHGSWEEWLKDNVDFSERQARKFMQIYKEIPNLPTSTVLTTSKAFELLSLPNEQRQEFIENHNVEEMTTRQLREAIKRQKELESENAQFIARIEELQSQPPQIIEKEMIPDDYEELKDALRQSIQNEKYQKERAEKIYSDNTRLIKENNSMKKADNTSELEKKLNNTAFTLGMRIRKFLEDVGGMVWILDYLSTMNKEDIRIIEVSINSMYGWVMSMKNQMEDE